MDVHDLRLRRKAAPTGTGALRRLAALLFLFGTLAGATAAQAEGALKGVTAYVRVVELNARIAGIVDRIAVSEGDEVDEGGVLLELDASLQRSRVAIAEAAANANGAVAKAEAQVRLASSRLNRIKRAAARGGAPKWEVREAEHAAAVARGELSVVRELRIAAEARLALEREALKQHYLKAPFNGLVLELDADRGQLAKGDEPLIVFADPTEMEIVIFLPVDQASDVRAAASQGRLTAELGAPVNQETPIRLLAIDSRIEPSSGTMRAVFRFDNAALGSPSGVSATISIQDDA